MCCARETDLCQTRPQSHSNAVMYNYKHQFNPFHNTSNSCRLPGCAQPTHINPSTAARAPLHSSSAPQLILRDPLRHQLKLSHHGALQRPPAHTQADPHTPQSQRWQTFYTCAHMQIHIRRSATLANIARHSASCTKSCEQLLMDDGQTQELQE